MLTRHPVLPTLLLSLGTLFLSATALAQTRYTVTQLTTFSVYPEYRPAYRLNDYGQIAAWHVTPSGAVHGYALNSESFLDLISPHTKSYAHGINSAGVVVGMAEDTDWASKTPCLWLNGSYSALNPIDNQFGGSANDINDGGLVVGWAGRSTTGNYLAVAWQNGNPIPLLDKAGYWSEARAVNNAGQVLLWSYALSGADGDPDQVLAYLWQSNTLQEIDPIGGKKVWPYGLNDNGQVVGASTFDTNPVNAHAFLWQNGTITDLDGGAPDITSHAMALNNVGQIVGGAGPATGIEEPALWQEDIRLRLNDLIAQSAGIVLDEAWSINDKGEILASGHDTPTPPAQPDSHLCLLSPVQVSKADLDGSGKPDILWQNSTTGDVGRWIMDGTAIASNVPIASAVPAEWRLAGTPELNGDTQADLLWQNSRTGVVAYWLMDKGKPVKSGVISDSVPLEWQVIATPDLDGDGCPDLLWRNIRTGDVAYWLLKGTSFLKGGTLMADVPLEWNLVGAADLDGDHQADLLWQHQKTGAVGYWLLAGLSVSKSSLLTGSVPTEWQVVGASDLNKSGETDVLWRNSKSGDVTYWHLHQQTVQATGWLAKNIPLQWKAVGMR